MADLEFNTTPGQTVGREMLIAYLNTGESGTPTWSPIGKRVEDSSIEFDWQTETKVDIFGDTYTTGKKATKTQTFDPCELDGADKAQQKIWNLAIKEQCQCPAESGYAYCPPVCRYGKHGSICGEVFCLLGIAHWPWRRGWRLHWDAH